MTTAPRPISFAVFAATLLAATLATAAPQTPRTDADPHPLAGEIVAVETGARLDPAELADALAQSDVAFLGETHDNPEHHLAQAWLVEALTPRGVAVEMLPPRLEDELARLRGAGAPREAVGAALEWEDRGWPDWEMYAPVLEAAPEAVVTGAEVGMEALGAAMEQGAAAAARQAIGAAAPRYGLDEALTPEQRAEAAAEQLAAHCDAIPEDLATQMVEAQLVRDAALADAALRAAALGEGDGPVVVIAGSGHARRDVGAPRALLAADDGLDVRSVAFIEVGEATDWRTYAGEAAFDYLWFTAAAERGDPCAAFLNR